MLWRAHVAAAFAAVCLSVSWPVFAFELADLNWRRMEEDAVAETKRIEGTWSDRSQWKATFCNGYYEYQVKLRADVTKVEFELTESGAIDVDAELKAIHGYTDGVYRGDASACIPVGGWLGVGADWAKIRAEATFDPNQEGLKGIRVRVIRTELGQLRLGKFVPGWMERFVTRQVNRALTRIWVSRIGAWLSEKISEYIRKNAPVVRP